MSAPYVDEEYDRCNIFNVDFTESMSRPSENTTTIACTAWEFATKPFQNTVMQRWSLVCDNDFYFKSISQSLFFAGHFFGTLIAGYLSDRFGRKRAFILTLLPAIGLTLGSYFVDNPYGWMALRFFIGLVQMAGTTIKAVYAVEWTSGKWRSFAQHYFVEIFFLTAQMTMGLLVYLVPDMRTLELVICIGIIPYLSYEFILPESPRWLISKGRIDEAKAILAKALKMNNLPMSRLDKLDKVSQAEIETEPSKDAFFTDLLKLPGARRNLLCISFCWFTFTMGYYGLIYNTPSFGWNLYITFCMPAFFTLPMLALQPFLENKLGRKPLMAFLMFLSGTLLLCTLAIPDGMFNHNWPVMVFAWIGTVACSTAFGVGIVLTKDLFPTTHRTMAFSMASASARLGSISSPYIALLANVSPLLGLAVYGCFLFIGAIVSIWIWPDTKNTKVPDTLEECEAMASSKNTWLFCCN